MLGTIRAYSRPEGTKAQIRVESIKTQIRLESAKAEGLGYFSSKNWWMTCKARFITNQVRYAKTRTVNRGAQNLCVLSH